MTLLKAIEILTLSLTQQPSIYSLDFKEAAKLLIEAGKDLIDIRATFPLIDFDKLPGETTE